MGFYKLFSSLCYGLFSGSNPESWNGSAVCGTLKTQEEAIDMKEARNNVLIPGGNTNKAGKEGMTATDVLAAFSPVRRENAILLGCF